MFKMSIKRFLCMSVATSSTLIAAEVVRIEAANYNLYPKPGSLKCEVGKTEVIQERPDSKDIKVVIKISGEMASVNSGQIVLERIPSYDFTDKGIEARFKLSQIVRKIYSADAITQGSFLSSLPNIDATLRAKIVPFEFITEATKVFAPGSNTDRVYYLPISVNFLTACVLELDQTKGEFKSFQPSTIFTDYFPYSNSSLLPKNINSLVDAAVDALVASTGTWDSPTVGERIVQKLGSIEPAINPFLDANGKIALSKSAIEKLTYRLASFREIDTNWDPMTNLVDYRKDPEKVGIKIADKKFRPEIADILLEQLIFNSYHQATRVGVNYDQRALVNLMKTLAGRIAFLMTDHQDDLADALSEEGSLFNLVKEMESLPDVSIYRINMPAKYSMPRLYLHQVRLIERRCYEGFKACGKTQRPE